MSGCVEWNVLHVHVYVTAIYDSKKRKHYKNNKFLFSRVKFQAKSLTINKYQDKRSPLIFFDKYKIEILVYPVGKILFVI